MAKKNDLREELQEYRINIGFSERVYCSPEETRAFNIILKNKGELPDGVYKRYDNEFDPCFYRIQEAKLTDSEKNEYIQYKKLSYLQTIKNCSVFFVIITLIGIIASIIIALR